VTTRDGYRIEPLGAGHDRSSFSCGVEPLDRYFHHLVGQDMRRGLASCFVATHLPDAAICGYYTLSAASVTLDELPPALAEKLPRYPRIPAALLGRLAVDQRFPGRRIGRLLLYDAMAQTRHANIAAAMLVVDAKDDAAGAFYRRYDFLPFGPGHRQFYLPIQDHCCPVQRW
jgi:ribosomal protein S18 acetylase RimI-like enzyme